jgi:hypothetical protein
MNWFNKKMEELDDINPYKLDWGLITIDGNTEGIYTHVINSDLTNSACEAKTSLPLRASSRQLIKPPGR